MTVLHRTALGMTAAIGGVVGIWAYGFPRAFYDTFPGVIGHWIDLDGPFNEHLIRDVGALYSALAAASVAGAALRRATVARVLGLGWTVFGVLHLAYHAMHLDVLSAADVVGNIVALVVTLLLGLILLLPIGRRSTVQAVRP